MGILNQKIFTQVKGVVALLVIFSFAKAQPSTDTGPSLGEAFNAGAPEIEPVVVGREKWNEKPQALPKTETLPSPSENDAVNNRRIIELDPLETQQVQPDPSELPLDPPKDKPATSIVRNFEGTLVFKPRLLGFESKFPYQLENSRGKRLAYIDVENIKGLDPQQFVDQSINVMGKLEPIEEGSDDLVIRARVMRPTN
jgi:hypothetical protein